MPPRIELTENAAERIFSPAVLALAKTNVPILSWALRMTMHDKEGNVVQVKGPHYTLGWIARDRLDEMTLLVGLPQGEAAFRLRPESADKAHLVIDFKAGEFIEIEGR